MKKIILSLISMCLLTSCFWNKENEVVVKEIEKNNSIVDNIKNDSNIEITNTGKLLSETGSKIEEKNNEVEVIKKEEKTIEKIILKDSLDIEVNTEKLGEYDYHIVGKTTRKFKEIQVVWKNNSGEFDNPYILKKYNQETGGFEYNIKQNLKNIGVGSNVYIFTGIDDSGNIFVEEIEIEVVGEKVFLDKDNHYSKDLVNVYYEGKIIEGANPLTFGFVGNVCNWNYEFGCWGKDKNNVYVGGKKVEGADPNSIKYIKSSRVSSLGGYLYMYLKDNNNVYITYGEKIKGADVNSFEVIKCLDGYYGSCYAKDKNSIYYYDTKLQGVNPNNFKLLDCLDAWEGAGYCYIVGDTKVFLGTEEIKGADANSFSYIYGSNGKILKGLKRDKYNVYDGTEKIEFSDPSTFTIVDCSDEMGGYGCIYKDKNNVYLNLDVIKGANPNTFKFIIYNYNGVYSKDNKSVYYNVKKLDNSDPLTFKILENGYSKDKNNVYYDGITLEGVDVNTFLLVQCNQYGCSENYSKDKNNVLCNGRKLEDVIPEKFRILNSGYVLGEDYVYYDCGKIEGADPKTFKFIYNSYGNFSWYSKDKNNVYYIVNGKRKLEGADSSTFQLIEDLRGFSATKDENNLYISGIRVTGFNVKKLKIIGGGYYKDDSNIYYEGVKVEGIDINTVEYIEGKYIKDKNFIYFEGKKVDKNTFEYKPDSFGSAKYDIQKKGLDIRTFKKLGGSYYMDKDNIYFNSTILLDIDIKTFVHISYEYAKDKNNVYFFGNKIEGADVNTFEVIKIDNYSYYSKDKDYIYYFGKNLSIEGDINFFKYLGGNYIKDDKYVYYNGMKIEGVDINTFVYFDESYAKDKNFLYHHGKRIELVGVDAISFEGIGGKYAKDKNTVYYGLNIIEGADTSTIKYFDAGYSKDSSFVYYVGKKIEGYNSKDFIYIGGEGYYMYLNNIYFKQIKIEGVDINTFVISEKFQNKIYSKDKNYVYYEGKIVEGANPDDY